MGEQLQDRTQPASPTVSDATTAADYSVPGGASSSATATATTAAAVVAAITTVPALAQSKKPIKVTHPKEEVVAEGRIIQVEQEGSSDHVSGKTWRTWAALTAGRSETDDDDEDFVYSDNTVRLTQPGHHYGNNNPHPRNKHHHHHHHHHHHYDSPSHGTTPIDSRLTPSMLTSKVVGNSSLQSRSSSGSLKAALSVASGSTAAATSHSPHVTSLLGTSPLIPRDGPISPKDPRRGTGGFGNSSSGKLLSVLQHPASSATSAGSSSTATHPSVQKLSTYANHHHGSRRHSWAPARGSSRKAKSPETDQNPPTWNILEDSNSWSSYGSMAGTPDGSPTPPEDVVSPTMMDFAIRSSPTPYNHRLGSPALNSHHHGHGGATATSSETRSLLSGKRIFGTGLRNHGVNNNSSSRRYNSSLSGTTSSSSNFEFPHRPRPPRVSWAAWWKKQLVSLSLLLGCLLVIWSAPLGLMPNNYVTPSTPVVTPDSSNNNNITNTIDSCRQLNNSSSASPGGEWLFKKVACWWREWSRERHRQMHWAENITSVYGTPNEFRVSGIRMSATNWNLVPITVGQSADLEVFARSEVGVGTDDELLGHVKAFERTVPFMALMATLADTSLLIPDPKNTVGKIIYMFYPYTLTLRGSIYYSTWFGLIVYDVPVCSVHTVDGPNTITSTPCL